MYPILFQFGDFTLASWHVFFVLGAFASWFALQSLRSYVCPDLSATALDRLFVLLYIAGYLGARLASILIEETHEDAVSALKALLHLGAMTLYGGIIAVALVLFLFALWRRWSLLRVASLTLGPGLLAIAIGRVGCFLNGDDYGKVVAEQSQPPFWAVVIPDLADGLYRHPVQLYEAVYCLLLAVILLLGQRRHPESPRLADVGVVGYTLGRFVLEFFRGDERGYFLGTGLSTSQGLSLVLLALWLVYRLVSRRRAPSLRA